MRLPVLLLLLLAGPALAADPLPTSDPRIDNAACKRVATPTGPQSLVLLPDQRTLLIASHDRRHYDTPGALFSYDIASHLLLEMPRKGEPAGLTLRPLHMDLHGQGKAARLYVLNNDEATPNSRHYSVLVYGIEKDRLVFRQRLTDPLLTSPNHISVAPDGDLYVTNDREDGSSLLQLLMQKKANVVHYRKGRGWEVVASGLSYANGVKAEAEEVMVVTRFGNSMLVWGRSPDGSLGPREQLAALPSLNGITPGPDPDTWLTVSQGPLLDFLRHRYFSDHPAPGTVFLVDASNRSFKPFFADDGHRISAMSSTVLTPGALYIGQAFDDFILRCPLKSATRKLEAAN